ncbi:hypothetical protein LSTR_LSTR008987 [Laodelphax striatellus]|uniref:Adenosine 5'-monophosphoramidase HINT3 n=1 Tax=Laodelphax striatellus TaxID=195883 RepID=A0A482WXM4_LAOST|nr:hypothetical protein LSTR_LSTR008987 [Laodelphax striatellus]
MATSAQSTEVVSSCIFCQIINENDPNKIIYEDEEIVSFADIKPASKCHYLIVPRKHIKDAKDLKTPEDKILVEKMVDVAKKILVEKNCDLSDARFGFHWPPFHTVSHLHMHAISPASEMGMIGRMIFRPDSLWFVSIGYLVDLSNSTSNSTSVDNQYEIKQ